MTFWKTLILATLPVLIDYFAEQYRKEDLKISFPAISDDYNLPHVKSYEFIIVGAGAAGCILARRLSDNPNVKVLLLEIGGDPPPQNDIPAYSVTDTVYTKTSSIAFEYYSVPQKYANNTVIKSIQGKVMGGGSSINTMVYNRGHPKDFDNWARITKDNSWRYENVLKHFKAVENYKGEFEIGDEHGIGGPITISKQNYCPGKEEWLVAGLEKGYQTRDPNGPQMTSFSPIEFNRDMGRRHSTYTRYIQPIESKRTNLKIIRYAEATELIFDENDTNKVTGVVYKHHGIFRAAYGTKEVILSAGAYGSPQILMKSGIGPKEILEKAKIQTKVNLPVGKNYLNHPVIRLKFVTNDSSILLNPNTAFNQKAIDNYEQKGTGPLTIYKSLCMQALLASSVAIADGQRNWPDYQLYIRGYLDGEPFQDSGTVFDYNIVVNRPKSRGTFSIDPKNINGPPILDFNWLEDKRDIQIFMDAIKFSIELFENTTVYKRKGVSLTKYPIPPCSHFEIRSEAYWKCHILNGLSDNSHPAGTCRMGSGPTDLKAVVDSKLKVIGVKGLRVVDASIFPDMTNANIQAPVYMIAEKMSAEIMSSLNHN